MAKKKLSRKEWETHRQRLKKAEKLVELGNELGRVIDELLRGIKTFEADERKLRKSKRRRKRA